MAHRPLAILGCTSDAGKSLITAAICRWFARQGIRVAPYKAQNMSNNARVVAGGEIGVAQWLQAHAAGVEPSVTMNPVLLKPEADTRSMVIVDGKPRPDIAATPWRDRGPLVWPSMRDAFDHLAATHELVIIEGAGSPAEVNLPDLVNNRIVEHADAAALLVADIDRGGAFAHIVGTFELVPSAVRERLGGFVLNKFRGDESLLDPAPAIVAERTGMPHAGTLPMLRHNLPDEEGGTVRTTPPRHSLTVAVIRYPFASNLDEWNVLQQVARVTWAQQPDDLRSADIIVLPGSKHVAADGRWLSATGLDRAVQDAAAAGTRVLGVCGGCMLLGESTDDPTGVEGSAPGLGILPLRTTMVADKITAPATVRFAIPDGPWSALDGHRADGYEIRHGRIESKAGTLGDLVWGRGSVLATTVHGVFETPDVLEALFGHRPADLLAETFELLADAVDAHLDTALLRRLVDGRS